MRLTSICDGLMALKIDDISTAMYGYWLQKEIGEGKLKFKSEELVLKELEKGGYIEKVNSMSNLGFGAMMSTLTKTNGDEALTLGNGNTIVSITIDTDKREDGVVIIRFIDGAQLELWDNARSCCESRWLHSDDDLPYFTNCTLVSVSVEGGDSEEDSDNGGNVKESEFIKIQTSLGMITVVAYNSHNGYYGGISINSEFTSAPEPTLDPADDDDED
jgi:hypothetical protein